VVLEEDNPAPVDENVEENKEKEEIVNEDVSSKEEVKSISIDELVKSYQNNQDQ
jgi:predicted S18 family serine protease